MQSSNLYNIMPDGTVKQVNPFTGTEVWAVPGRKSKPIANEVPPTASPLQVHEPEDYCSFCPPRYFETPPEKSRLVRWNDGRWERLDALPPDQQQAVLAAVPERASSSTRLGLSNWTRWLRWKPPRRRSW